MADKVFTVSMPDMVYENIKRYARCMHLSESEAVWDLVSIAFDYMAKPYSEHPGVCTFNPAEVFQLGA